MFFWQHVKAREECITLLSNFEEEKDILLFLFSFQSLSKILETGEFLCPGPSVEPKKRVISFEF